MSAQLRLLSRFSLQVSLIVLTMVNLMTINAIPAAAQGRGGFTDSEFGPTPESFYGQDFGTFTPDSRLQNRAFDVDDSMPRSRDPARRPAYNTDDRGAVRRPSRTQSWEQPLEDVGRGWDRIQPEDDGRPVARPRTFQVEDLPVPPRNNRTPAAPSRTTPASPVKAVTEPTLSEKIAQRYADPKVVRVAQQMTVSNGEALFAEVSQYIDQRHIQPTSYQDRVRAGLESLSMAVQTPSFQQALNIRPDAQRVRSLQQNLQGMGAQVRVQSLNDAVGVMRQAGQNTAQALGVNAGVASLEFVYASLGTLDKFSMFIAPEKSGEASVGLQENMVGIGVEIEAHAQGLKILKALAGGPAAAATLQRGDIITAIDGQSVAGMPLNNAVELIAGAVGSPVQLQLRRDSMVGDVTLVRRPFEVHSLAEVRMEEGNVGYIKLDQFAQNSSKEMDAALWSLHNQGMQSLVIDLRGNPGGLLTTAIELSDKFLPSGTIVSTRGRNVNDNSQETAQSGNTWKVPLVVMVDHNSASASEIFAAAIQENRRGVIVGEKSYGKGTVQTLFPLKSVSSALRLTTAKFYSPNGREMAGAGVTPDINVTNSSDRSGEDATLRAAIQAATDPRLIDMAEKSSRDRSALRVIRVAI